MDIDKDLMAAVDLVNNRDRISFNVKSRAIRVCYGGQHGKQVYFSVPKYGSWLEAAKAAIKFEASLSEYDRMAKRRPHRKPSTRSMSGIVGVSPYYDPRRDPDQLGWVAQWSEDTPGGKTLHRQKLFLFSTYGLDAKDFAEEFREEMIRELHPYLYQAEG